ncbi:hypothetical protein PoB_002624300 [Plakobranchus ocellatus]|uniref:Uncharacterized protein n=1 Tax=Plakobranchus ocellatus TaxID=259542 RepID=A0AAV3ZXW9_9GAST|nr:hypothetical protein PoB_002624300 [Plakobranchus ocellatus]
MATQTDAFDPRAEVLAASRYRSGSVKMDNRETQPPVAAQETGSSISTSSSKSTTSQFRNLRTKFEEKDAAASGGQISRPSNTLFGSSVSKMKQRFQAGRPDDNVGDAPSGPVAARGRSNDRSPESKRKKVSEGHGSPIAPALDPKRRTCSVDSALPSGQQHLPVYASPPLSPTHTLPAKGLTSGRDSKTKQGFSSVANQKPSEPATEPALSEPTNHVQRFNYTMALFARMEEETRRAQEREKVIRRKVSPSRLSIQTGGTSSPLLSPSAHENHSFPSPNTDSLQRSRRSKSIPQESISEVSSSRPNSDCIVLPDGPEEERFRSGSDKSQGSDDLKTETAVRSPLRTKEGRDRNGKFLDAGSVEASSDLKETKVSSESSNRAVITSEKSKLTQAIPSVAEDPDLPPTSVLPHSSRLDHSSRPSQRAQHQAKPATTPGLSSSAPTSASSSPHSRTSDARAGAGRHSEQSLPSSTSETSADVVTRRLGRTAKTDASSRQQQEETAKKRLSKEEIESALERADTYLANLEAVPDTLPVKKNSEHPRHTESSTAAARRRFLYGDTSASPSPPSSSSSSPSKKRSSVQSDQTDGSTDIMVAQTAKTQHASAPASQTPTSAFDELSMLLRDADEDVSAGGEKDRSQQVPNTPPPPYHEAPEPPPYEIATSSSSMLISQRVSSSEQQETVTSRPVPVPRRAAPPVPQQPPASRTTPPPPAPEPGSAEFVRQLRTQGNRHALILDKDTADDLILPEEHLAHHNLDG